MSIEQAKSVSLQMMRMPLFWFENDTPMCISCICDVHPVYRIDHFLSPGDCQWLIEYGRTNLRPSTTVLSGTTEIIDKSRTSRTAMLTISGQEESIHPVLQMLMMKVSALSGYPISHIESINLTHYSTDQYFKPHHDYFNSNGHGKDLLSTSRAGQRIATFFIYLNTLEEADGGATRFPLLNLSVQPQCGTAIFWLNTNVTGETVYSQTLHEGSPVLRGEKWGINVWIRQCSFMTGLPWPVTTTTTATATTAATTTSTAAAAAATTTTTTTAPVPATADATTKATSTATATTMAASVTSTAKDAPTDAAALAIPTTATTATVAAAVPGTVFTVTTVTASAEAARTAKTAIETISSKQDHSCSTPLLASTTTTTTTCASDQQQQPNK